MTEQPSDLWSLTIDLHGPRVHFAERSDRRYKVYAHWSVGGAWRWKAIKTADGAPARVRPVDSKGQPGARTKALERETKSACATFYDQVVKGTSAPEPAKPAAPLLVADTWSVVSDAQLGLYPVLTEHAKDVRRSLIYASRILGKMHAELNPDGHSIAWNEIERAHIRLLGRARVDELRKSGKDGLRGAIVTVGQVLTVAGWLRDERKIAAMACMVPREWQDDVRDYWVKVTDSPLPSEGDQPRHSLDEMLGILARAGEVDPRFDLLLQLGAEYRLGQVARLRRSAVSPEERRHTIKGKGKKRGEAVDWTVGQADAWAYAVGPDGYLRDLEAAYQAGTLPDYDVFPRGQMPGGRSGRGVATLARHAAVGQPVGKTFIRKAWLRVEELAGVEHVEGRCAYGVRRIAVDAAKEAGISREGLKAHGGWRSNQIPDAIYASKEAGYARAEAAKVRATIRGEPERHVAETYPGEKSGSAQPAPSVLDRVNSVLSGLGRLAQTFGNHAYQASALTT